MRVLNEKITDLKPEKVFLYLAIIFGLSFLIVTPPFQVPDDAFHFYHIYNISEFYANTKEGMETVPKSYEVFDSLFSVIPFHNERKISPSDILSLLSQKEDVSIKRDYFFNPASSYSFTLYFPQIAGVIIGRAFSAPPIVIYYLSRIFAMISWVVLVYFAVKIIPVQKWLLILLALTPISLFQGVSVSADSAVNSVSFLLIAIILKYAFDNRTDKLCFKNFIFVIILSVAVTMSKPLLLAMLFLFFVIPIHKFENRRKYLIIFAIIIISNLIFIYLWNLIVKTPLNTGMEKPKTQFINIFLNPSDFLNVLLNTFAVRFKTFFSQFVGVLGWLDVVLPAGIIIFYIAAVMFTALFDKSGIEIEIGKKKTIFLLIVAAYILMVFTVFYCVATPGTKEIWSFQGRYLIPVHVLIFLLLYFKKFKLKEEFVKLAVMITSVVALLSGVVSLVNRYYYF